MAAAFLQSYLAYEMGRATFRDLHLLRQAATSQLWSRLNAGRGEPHAPRTVPATHLARLIPGVAARRGVATLLANLQRGGRAAGLALVLCKERGQWRVAGVGE